MKRWLGGLLALLLGGLLLERPALAQATCGDNKTQIPGMVDAPAGCNQNNCNQWEIPDSATSDLGQSSKYGGNNSNFVGEVDGVHRLAQEDFETGLVAGRPYVLSLKASRNARTNCDQPATVSADITYAGTLIGTVSRSNTTWALTTSTFSFTPSSTGQLIISANTTGTECGIVFDDIEIFNQAEDGSVLTMTPPEAIIGNGFPLVVGNLVNDGDSYEIFYSVTSADGTATDLYSTTGTASGGQISFIPTQVAGDTLRVYQVDNLTTGCLGNTADLSHTVLFPSSARIVSFEAMEDDERVVLRWRSALEVDSLGFVLYRELPDGRRVRLNERLIAGSALQLRGARTAQGRTYHWVLGRDAEEAPLSSYLLQSVATNGSRREYRASWVQASLAWQGSSPLLGARPRRRSPALAVDLSGRLPGSRLTELHTQRAVLAIPGRGPGARLALQGQRVAVIPESSWSARERPRAPHPDLCLLPSDAQRRQWRLAADGGAVKILVGETGLQRINRAALLAAGLPASARGEELALFFRGRPVALRVIEAGASFEAIEFFGHRLDTSTLGEATYWLALDRAAARRFAPSAAVSAGGRVTSFVETVAHEPRAVYITSARNIDGDNFYAEIVGAEPTQLSLALPSPAPDAGAEAWLELRLRGLSAGEHELGVRLNGVSLGKVSLSGRVEREAGLSVPQRLLLDGSNQLELRTLAGGGGETFIALKHARLSYRRLLLARADRLAFTAPAGAEIAIDGFSGSGVELLDVSYPRAIRVVVAEVDARDGGYRLRARAPGQGTRTRLLWAGSATARVTSARVVANHPSRWSADGQQAGLALITHGEFAAAAERLAAHRRGQGWRVAVIDVGDLYDEFSFGDGSVAALRCFLGRARRAWLRWPSHVLLLGDASYDPRDFLGLGAPRLAVPTKGLADGELVAPADQWILGVSSGEAVVGRLPVRTPVEAEAVVDRLLAFDGAPTADWQRRLLFISDTDHAASGARGYDFHGYDFHQAQATLAEEAAAAGFAPESLAVSPSTRAPAREQLLGALTAGVGLVDYFGHGSVQVWSGSFVDGDVADGLTNTKLPLVLGATCLNGMFDDLYTRSLAERLVVRGGGGGAIAAIASSNRGFPSRQHALKRKLLTVLTARETATLGQGLALAKARAGGSLRFWHLFGDPSLQLPAMSRPFSEVADDPRLGVPVLLSPRAQLVSPPPVAGAESPEEPVPTTPEPAASPPQAQTGNAGCQLGGEGAQSWPLLCLLLLLLLRRRCSPS